MGPKTEMVQTFVYSNQRYSYFDLPSRSLTIIRPCNGKTGTHHQVTTTKCMSKFVQVNNYNSITKRNWQVFFSISLVESIPIGLVYPSNAIQNPSTYQTWLDLINMSQHTIEIGSFYWTLRQSEVYPDPSSQKVIFQIFCIPTIYKLNY